MFVVLGMMPDIKATAELAVHAATDFMASTLSLIEFGLDDELAATCAKAIWS